MALNSIRLMINEIVAAETADVKRKPVNSIDNG